TAFSRFGSSTALDSRFRSWLDTGPPEFKPILQFPGWERSQGFGAKHFATARSGFALSDPFLPVGLQNLDVLARGERPSPEDRALPVSLLFERRTADAFRCLGFEVSELGQGKGRSADCVAIARREGFAVIIDAKWRST